LDRASNAAQGLDSATNLVAKAAGLGLVLVGAIVAAVKAASRVFPWWGTTAVAVVLVAFAVTSVGFLVAWGRLAFARRQVLETLAPKSAAVDPPEPKLSATERARIEHLRDLLRDHRDGFTRIGNRIGNEEHGAELLELERRLERLFRPASMCVQEASSLLGTAPNTRFANAHPLLVLARPPQWSDAHFQLYERARSYEKHLDDFVRYLHQQVGPPAGTATVDIITDPAERRRLEEMKPPQEPGT
jgi:hypothetical protein